MPGANLKLMEYARIDGKYELFIDGVSQVRMEKVAIAYARNIEDGTLLLKHGHPISIRLWVDNIRERTHRLSKEARARGMITTAQNYEELAASIRCAAGRPTVSDLNRIISDKTYLHEFLAKGGKSA